MVAQPGPRPLVGATRRNGSAATPSDWHRARVAVTTYDERGPLVGEGEVSPEAVRALSKMLVDRLVAVAVGDLDLAHLVICTHLATGVTSYQGPYRDALAAAAAADRDAACLGGEGGEGELRFSIAPLLHPESAQP